MTRGVNLLPYLALPLRSAPLLLVVIFSVMLTITQAAGFLGIALGLITGSWFLKYSFVLMDHVADGITEPPVLSIEMVNPASEQRPLGLLLIMVAFYAATVAVGSFIGTGTAAFLQLIGLLLLPAVVATMGATRRFAAGLNPVLVIALVLRIPGTYLAVLSIIVLLWIAVPAIAAATGATGAMPTLIVIAGFMFLWLAVFACIGGMLYEQRHELGLDVAVSPERTQARRDADLERVRDLLMDGWFAQWRGGSHGDVWAAIKNVLDSSPQPLVEYRWLYARTASWEDPRLAGYLAHWAIPRLIDVRATSELLDIVKERLRAQPDFRPLAAAQLVSVVNIARSGGELALARTLLQDFERHYPDDPAAQIVAQLRGEN